MANTSLNSSINLVDLDFAGLQASFISYLRNQALFKDYDFDGSNLKLLIDLMSYNTFKNGFYLNMAISEGFLDSAQMRNSILSHAKELNYLPRSIRSAKASLTVSFEATGETQPYIIPKGSQFSTLIKSKSFVFSTPETIVCSSANTSFEFTTDVYEGVYKKDIYIFRENLENQRFKITNKNVDTRSISVVVKEDGAEVGDIYTLTNTLLDLNETSKVFFVQTSETGFYEVFFGDNNLGREPKINSTIILDYRLSAGTAGNGAKAFSIDFDPTAPENELTDTPVIVTGDVANNGEEEESNESVRYYAPRHFQVQERTITTTDYEVALKTQFPEINAVSVYGGEDATPPQFGRVFISVDISEVDGLPESKKTEYYNFIKRRSPLSIDPIFLEPSFLYLTIDTTVRYNLNITLNTSARIKTIVTDVITAYNEDNLNDFNATLRYSKFLESINGADVSIVSNITDVAIYTKLNPHLGIPQNIDINFNMPLIATIPDQADSHMVGDLRAIYSSFFVYNGSICTLEDDSNGIIRVIKQSNDQDVKVVDVGTVDYDTGAVKLTNFSIDSYDGAALKIFAVPRDKDITSGKNTILTIEPDEIHITTEALRE